MTDANFSRALEVRLWRNTWLVAALTFLFFIMYMACLDGTFTLAVWAKVVAGTSGLLLAYSLSLSTWGYYFDFLDRKVIYRKYLGLAGYWLALLYSVMLLFLDPDRYWFGLFENFWSADIFLGLVAMSILTVMALISNTQALRMLGAKRWRTILRLGYLAFFLLVLRGVILEGDIWQAWLVSGSGLPPLRLFLSFVALFVIFFRFSINFSEKRRYENQVSQGVPSS